MLLARKAAPDMSAALSSGGECWRGGGSGDEDLEAVPGNESYWIYEKWDEGIQVRKMVNLNVQVLVIFPHQFTKIIIPSYLSLSPLSLPHFFGIFPIVIFQFFFLTSTFIVFLKLNTSSTSLKSFRKPAIFLFPLFFCTSELKHSPGCQEPAPALDREMPTC